MKKVILLAIGGLTLLAGCGTMGDTDSKTTPAPAKWKAPYQIEFAAQPAKPNPGAVILPGINYTATSKALERRAALVLRLDVTGDTKPARDQMITGPVDIPDASGTLSSGYMDSTDKGLATLLTDACMKGPVKIKVALVRSSIKPDAGDGEIDAKRLSDWLTTEVPFKNPHPKC